MARDSVNETSEAAADLIAIQLSKGQQKDGKFSRFEYAELTKILKKGKPGLSGITSHLTNYDTGESYRRLYVRVSGENIIAGTFTDKESSISKRMKGKAFGLTKESREEYIRQNVQPNFNKRLREIIKL